MQSFVEPDGHSGCLSLYPEIGVSQMLVDSLLMTVLIGTLSNGEIPIDYAVYDYNPAPITISVTIEIGETVTIEPVQAEPPTNPIVASQSRPQVESRPYVITSIDRIDAFATAWQATEFFDEAIGFLSVGELAVPASWKFRTTITRSLNTQRGERIQWSLVHGIF